MNASFLLPRIDHQALLINEAKETERPAEIERSETGRGCSDSSRNDEVEKSVTGEASSGIASPILRRFIKGEEQEEVGPEEAALVAATALSVNIAAAAVLRR